MKAHTPGYLGAKPSRFAKPGRSGCPENENVQQKGIVGKLIETQLGYRFYSVINFMVLPFLSFKKYMLPGKC